MMMISQGFSGQTSSLRTEYREWILVAAAQVSNSTAERFILADDSRNSDTLFNKYPPLSLGLKAACCEVARNTLDRPRGFWDYILAAAWYRVLDGEVWCRGFADPDIIRHSFGSDARMLFGPVEITSGTFDLDQLLNDLIRHQDRP
ncbi:MAG: hypothetical protein JNL18_18700 [Planctomycetaceae bacterium]|nr:hypothetical protein [Planctomycetaceae bacterium]